MGACWNKGSGGGVSQQKGWLDKRSGRGRAKAFCTSCKGEIWVRGRLRDARAKNSDGLMDKGSSGARHVAHVGEEKARDLRVNRESTYSPWSRYPRYRRGGGIVLVRRGVVMRVGGVLRYVGAYSRTPAPCALVTAAPATNQRPP